MRPGRGMRLSDGNGFRRREKRGSLSPSGKGETGAMDRAHA